MKEIAEIVHEQIYRVTGCKDLKSGELYLSKELTEAILALISQREQGMREALQEWKQVVADSYSLYMPTNRVQDMLDDVLSLIDTALKGEGK